MNTHKIFGASLMIVAALLAGLSLNCAAEQATDEMFATGTLEYHFVLNDTVNVAEEYMPTLPAQIVEELAPMYIIKAEGKHNTGMYVDTKDRALDKLHLILRVKKGKITIKARGASPEAVVDLEKCDKKKYEVDYFGSVAYSVSTDIKFKEEEFDIDFVDITPKKLYAFVLQECPAAYEHIKPITENPYVRIPGVASQYKFKASLRKDHPLAEKIEVDFAIWFFPPTDETVLELAYTGDAADKEDLDQLQAETFEFLKTKGLLHPDQTSKTQYYFNTFLSE